MNFVQCLSNTDCHQLHKLGVPLDQGDWLEPGYLIRTISEHAVLSVKQKKSIQEKLILVFRNKKFNSEEYAKVIAEIEEIRHMICQEKIESVESVIKGMSKVLSEMGKDVGGMINNQLEEVISLDRLLRN